MDRKPGIIVSAAVIVAMLAFSGWAWGQLPADVSIPVHWGIDGTPDRSSGKFEGVVAAAAHHGGRRRSAGLPAHI
ncbi:MAG: DUF1648 domain-containing protein [Chloroflexi bacterium]|nr:DUF1648 domain-containing protein [Chloroflexota bacterium]